MTTELLEKKDDKWFGGHRIKSLPRASAWAALHNMSQGLVQLVSAVVMSRLVPVEAFGIFGIVLIFYRIITQLMGRGFSSAVVQKAELDRQSLSNFFWFTFYGSALFGLLLVVLGPFVALIYRDTIFISLCAVLGGLIWFDGSFTHYQALVQRNLRYDILLFSSLLANVTGLVAGICLAIQGFGIWALVAQLLCSSIIMRLSLAYVVPWRPTKYRRGTGTITMFKFGGRASFGVVVDSLFTSIPSLVMGRLAGLAEVGMFNRGEALFQRPFQQLTYPLASLFLPSMSAVQDNSQRLHGILTQSLWGLTLVLVPMLAVVANFGDLIALLLIGSKYLQAGEVMQWFAVAGFLVIARRPLTAANAAIGKPARASFLKVIFVPIALFTIAAVASYGPVIVAMVFTIIRYGMFPVELTLLISELGGQKRLLLKEVSLIATTCVCVHAVGWGLKRLVVGYVIEGNGIVENGLIIAGCFAVMVAATTLIVATSGTGRAVIKRLLNSRSLRT